MMNIYISENPNPNKILQNSFLKTVVTLFNQTYLKKEKQKTKTVLKTIKIKNENKKMFNKANASLNT